MTGAAISGGPVELRRLSVEGMMRFGGCCHLWRPGGTATVVWCRDDRKRLIRGQGCVLTGAALSGGPVELGCPASMRFINLLPRSNASRPSPPVNRVMESDRLEAGINRISTRADDGGGGGRGVEMGG